LGENWEQVKEWLKPLDTLLLIVGVPALILVGAWRLGLLARLRGARRSNRTLAVSRDSCGSEGSSLRVSLVVKPTEDCRSPGITAP
ncbi:MAG: hypothetical protein ACKOPF_06200, partial [Candidatus Limnocylindrus sp.]